MRFHSDRDIGLEYGSIVEEGKVLLIIKELQNPCLRTRRRGKISLVHHKLTRNMTLTPQWKLHGW